jgi:hypothetical protein
MFMLVLAAGVAGIFAWNFPASRDFTCRFRQGLGIDLRSLTVNFMRDGGLVRGTTYFYDRGPGKGPVSQDHKVRLPPGGGYSAVFVFNYSNGDRRELSVPVIVERFRYAYTLDLSPP